MYVVCMRVLWRFRNFPRFPTACNCGLPGDLKHRDSVSISGLMLLTQSPPPPLHDTENKGIDEQTPRALRSVVGLSLALRN